MGLLGYIPCVLLFRISEGTEMGCVIVIYGRYSLGKYHAIRRISRVMTGNIFCYLRILLPAHTTQKYRCDINDLRFYIPVSYVTVRWILPRFMLIARINSLGRCKQPTIRLSLYIRRQGLPLLRRLTHKPIHVLIHVDLVTTKCFFHSDVISL